jgi:hypothetical protein
MPETVLGVAAMHEALCRLWEECEEIAAKAQKVEREAEALAAEAEAEAEKEEEKEEEKEDEEVPTVAETLFTAAVHRLAACIGGALDHAGAGLDTVALTAAGGVSVTHEAAGGAVAVELLKLPTAFEAAGFARRSPALGEPCSALDYRRGQPKAAAAAQAARGHLLRLDAAQLRQLRAAFDAFDRGRRGWLIGWASPNPALAGCGHALRAVLRAAGVNLPDEILRRRLAAMPLPVPGLSAPDAAEGGEGVEAEGDEDSDDEIISDEEGETGADRVWFCQLACLLAEFISDGSGALTRPEPTPPPFAPLVALPTTVAVLLHPGPLTGEQRWHASAAALQLSASRRGRMPAAGEAAAASPHGSAALQLTVAASWPLPPPPPAQFGLRRQNFFASALPPAALGGGGAVAAVAAVVVVGGGFAAGAGGARAARLRTVFAIGLEPGQLRPQAAPLTAAARAAAAERAGGWAELPPMLSCRSSPAAVWMPDDLTAGHRDDVGPGAVPRGGASGARAPRASLGRLVVLGGHGGGGDNEFEPAKPRGYVLRGVECLALGRGSAAAGAAWVPLPPMLHGRANFGAAALPGGIIAVAGGCDATGSSMREAEVYEPGRQAWRPLPLLCSAREGVAVATCGPRTLLAVGGDAAGAPEVLLLPPHNAGLFGDEPLTFGLGWTRLPQRLEPSRGCCALASVPVVFGGGSSDGFAVLAVGGAAGGGRRADCLVLDDDHLRELEHEASALARWPQWQPAEFDAALFAGHGEVGSVAVVLQQ